MFLLWYIYVCLYTLLTSFMQTMTSGRLSSRRRAAGCRTTQSATRTWCPSPPTTSESLPTMSLESPSPAPQRKRWALLNLIGNHTSPFLPFVNPKHHNLWCHNFLAFAQSILKTQGKKIKLVKGEAAKTRPPETLNCSKFKTCRAKKLKLHQPVYLIR